MILEGTGLLTASVPAAGLPVGFSTSIDLWPQGAEHISGSTLAPFKGKPPLVGDGEQMFAQFRIETPFVVGGGNPVAQFLVIQSLAQDGSAADSVIVGVATGPTQSAAGFVIGFAGLSAATVGLTVEVPIGAPNLLNNPVAAADFNLFRYLVVGIYVPNFVGGTNFFSSGSISAKFMHTSQREPRSRIYPAAFNIR